MSDSKDIIDVEAVEIEGSDNLPAVIPRPTVKDSADTTETHGTGAPIEGRDWSTYSRPERRCTAHSSRTGDQCKNAAIKGHNVCRYHGGAAKQIKRAAQTRLDNAAEIMAKQLLGLALTAENEGVQLAAVKDALDRTIGKAPTPIEVDPAKPWEEVLDGISGMTREESRRARGVSDASDDIAGLYDGAHLHASSQIGPEGQSSNPPTQSDPPHPDDHGDTGARRNLSNPAGDTGDDDYLGDWASGQHEAPDSPDSSVHRPGPRQFDRHGQPERRQPSRSQIRHVTGDDAIRIANETNRAIGALPPMRELTSGHKRYPRP